MAEAAVGGTAPGSCFIFPGQADHNLHDVCDSSGLLCAPLQVTQGDTVNVEQTPLTQHTWCIFNNPCCPSGVCLLTAFVKSDNHFIRSKNFTGLEEQNVLLKVIIDVKENPVCQCHSYT